MELLSHPADDEIVAVIVAGVLNRLPFPKLSSSSCSIAKRNKMALTDEALDSIGAAQIRCSRLATQNPFASTVKLRWHRWPPLRRDSGFGSACAIMRMMELRHGRLQPMPPSKKLPEGELLLGRVKRSLYQN